MKSTYIDLVFDFFIWITACFPLSIQEEEREENNALVNT